MRNQEVFGPAGRQQGEPLLPGVIWCDDPYDTMIGADALVILTEWNEIRGLDLNRARELMRDRVFVDLRNIYPPAEVIEAGFQHTGVGRGNSRA